MYDSDRNDMLQIIPLEINDRKDYGVHNMSNCVNM